MGPYLPLFSIEIEHGFFTDGRCRHLEFVPADQTRSLTRNCGLLTRQDENSLHVFYDRSNLESLQRHAAGEESLRLGFKVISQDPLFGNYTEPDVPSEDAILFRDNLQLGEADDDGRFPLTTTEAVSASDLEPLDSPKLTGLLDPRDRLVRPLLAVNIHLTPTAVTPEGDSSVLPATRYYLRFNSRQTFWKYYLQGGLARDGLRITDADERVAFDALGTTTWADQRSALVYRSQTPLPLRERAEYRFQLRESNGGNGRVLIRRLPVASASQLGRDTVAEATVMTSEIFVNG